MVVQPGLGLGFTESRSLCGSHPGSHQIHHIKNKVLKRQGSRNEQEGQRLAPKSVGGVGEASPHKTLSKEGDNPMKAVCNRFNHVQSTTREITRTVALTWDPNVKVAQPVIQNVIL